MRTTRWSLGTLFLTAALVSSGTASIASASPPTKVLVVGTLHQMHMIDKNFSYADIIRILATYNPDLICVEIRPQDFRRVPYLKEMELATVWGLSHGKRVAPIDWYEGTAEENDRTIRAKLEKEPEYVAKQKQIDELVAHDVIITNFVNHYGTLDEEFKWGGQLGYGFWNGKEYNDVVAEGYKLSMQVYGDSPFNLHYVTRNTHMVNLIWNAIRDNSSHRVIVLTGSEHKHFFDRELEKNPEVRVVDFDNILPLRTVKLPPSITRFLDEDDDLAYFQKGYPKDLDAYYFEKLTPLVHGPNMDVYPATVPPANIKLADMFLARWKSAVPSSNVETFEWGWYKFLNQDYRGAVALLRPLADRLDQGEESAQLPKWLNQFIQEDAHMILGHSYDMLHERTKALDCYHHVEKLLAGTREEQEKAYIMQDYEKVPYHPSKPPRSGED